MGRGEAVRQLDRRCEVLSWRRMARRAIRSRQRADVQVELELALWTEAPALTPEPAAVLLLLIVEGASPRRAAAVVLLLLVEVDRDPRRAGA